MAREVINFAGLGAAQEQARRRSARKIAADINVGLAGENSEVTITLRGQTLINASMAAAQLCVPVQRLMGVMANDLRNEITEFVGQNGALFDMLNFIDYPNGQIEQQAHENMAMVSRAHRLVWIKKQLKQLKQVWPKGDHGQAPRRVYTDGRNHYVYTAAPEELIVRSSDNVLRFMNGETMEPREEYLFQGDL